jgi:hypothetical protein
MPLSKFIEAINKPLENLVSGIKVFGIAEPISRTTGTVTEIIPGIVGNDGEIKYVGVDDLNSVIIYHKASALGVKPSTVRKGYGDEPNNIVNAYAMSMIVYIDRSKVKMKPDEFFLFIQANFPFQIEETPYSLILTQINTVILNSQAVYDSEYKGAENRLPANHSLMQINYTIESTFRQNCFEKCPEDC